jgi:alcohol dehydrogenase (cytochrome c)
MAVGLEVLKCQRASIRSSIVGLISFSFAVLFLCPVSGWGEEALTDGAGSRSDDWITINKDYSSQRYVDLDQITPKNVHRLKEVCEIQLNEPVYFNSGILKVGRTLYTTTLRATYAFDAVTCKRLWQHVIKFQKTIAGLSNRGAAYLDGKIFRGTADGHVIALDANTGLPLPTWPKDGVAAADPTIGEAFVSAPIAWHGRVFIGIGVSDSGIAGRLMAFDAETGDKKWSFNTTLGFPSGGGFWATYSLDPKTREVFGPVANPYPDFSRFVGFPPPNGDLQITKYTDSIIAVDADTGHLNWSYQLVPGDEHDWDLSPAPTLYRTTEKKPRDLLAIAGKDGHVYGIDRETQLLAFKKPATTLENDQEPLNNTWMRVCPGQNGGAMFNGAAYHPGTGELYVGMVDFCAWYWSNAAIPTGGAPIKDWASAAKLQAPRGWITAIDSKSGDLQWKYQTESQVLAGMVPTKSGLLFAGDTHGNLLMFDAKTKNENGSLLHSIDTGGALNSGLISYAVDGNQYVAAAVGGASENPNTVAGPLRVVIYGLHGSDKPMVVVSPRLEPEPVGKMTANQMLFEQNCRQCHGVAGAGASAPPLARQSQLADRGRLKQFLETVPPPMPRLYPGVLTEDEVAMIADYLKTDVFKCGSNEPQSCKPPPLHPMTGGTPTWRAIYSVLTSPRCINCHPVASPKLDPYLFNPATNAAYPQDYPRQGDDRHPHYYTVLRGNPVKFRTAEDTGFVYPGTGTDFEHCTFCHGNKNDPVTGIPGTTNPHFNPGQPFWFLAPASMAWESEPGVPLNGPQLCAALLDKTLNGNREPKDLLHHVKTEPLVKWSFNPGTRLNGEERTKPPISHEALIRAFQEWIKEGTPCPAQ